MKPNERPKLLQEIGEITGTPTGIASSYFQESVYPQTDWMDLLRTRGINPDLRQAWRNCILSPLTTSPIKQLGTVRANVLEESVYNHGLQIISKVGNEYKRRGVEDTGYCNINLDADILEETLDIPSKGGTAFNNGLNRINELGLDSRILTNFFINQFAGLNPEAAADAPFVENRFQKIKASMNPALEIKSINTEDVDFHKTIDTVRELGGTQYRNSLELGRIFPSPGEFNEQEYSKLKGWITYCKETNISPNLCLNHFTFPDWMVGGWSEPVNQTLYENCSMEVLKRLKEDGVMPDRILTQNEPQGVISAGEIAGVWPPFHSTNLLSVGAFELLREKLPGKNFGAEQYVNAMNNSVQSHINLYNAIKKLDPNISVGFTYNLPMLSPINGNPLNKFVSNMVRRGNNEWFKTLMDKSVENGKFPADFVGLQYYNEFEIGILKQTLKDTAYSMNLKETEKLLPNGWKRHPEGALVQMLHISRWLMQTAMKIGTTELPDLAITETGVPSNVNQNNGLGEYHVLAKAIGIGKELIPNNVPFTWIWTLFDDLEWSSGVTPTFGILKPDGSNKPEASIPPQPLNIGSAHVILELQKHIDTMKRFEKQFEGEKGKQAETQLKNIRSKIKLTELMEIAAIKNLNEI